jgi:hypothetical protein
MIGIKDFTIRKQVWFTLQVVLAHILNNIFYLRLWLIDGETPVKSFHTGILENAECKISDCANVQLYGENQRPNKSY